VHRRILVTRGGERISSAERDRGRAEQPNQDPSMRSASRPPRLRAGIRVRAATESCNKPSI